MNKFGETLRRFRNRCNDPYDAARRLSQERLGELIGNELETQGFSGAAVSDWERDKSKIHADDRLVLTSLLAVLRRQGGIQIVSEANELLEAGNYRTLNFDELQKVFPDGSELSTSYSSQREHPNVAFLYWIKSHFAYSEALKELVARAKEGPSPTWPCVLTALLRSVTDRISAVQVLKASLWIWLLLTTWATVMPSLRWPFTDRIDMEAAIFLYAAATLALPLLVGLLTTTRDNEFWQQHNLANSAVTRLYTYQGAFIGFHLGYFAVFALNLLRYYLQFNLTIWFELALMAITLIVAYAGARLVPHNLWQAYNRLSLADGSIFFSFIALGPIWGMFFWKFSPVILAPITGGFVILGATTLVVMATVLQRRRK